MQVEEEKLFISKLFFAFQETFFLSIYAYNIYYIIKEHHYYIKEQQYPKIRIYKGNFP